MKKFLIFFVLCLFGWVSLYAQKTVTGTIIDSDGISLPGASVLVKGTTEGTVTDIDGNYTINVPEGGTLVYSFAGMQSQEVIVGNQVSINITLSYMQLEELLVVGYSTKSKDVITSAVSNVTSRELSELVPSTSVDNMLQGKASGVDVTSLNGKPGTTATVKIRGSVSLNTFGGVDRSQPLYVVDGVFLDEDLLNIINPNDIESMSVLKDASASAIYGSRGANGVIIITTKRGRKDEPAKISVSARYGFGKKIKDPYDMMNAAQKIAYEEELGVKYTDEEKVRLLSFDHDWQDDILKNAIIQSYAISATGGGEKSSYYVSLGYDQNTGIIDKLNGFEKISGRMNYTNQLKKNVTVGTSMALSYSKSDEPRDRNNVQNPFRAMYDYNAYEPVYRHDKDGNIEIDENGKPIYNNTHKGLSIQEALNNNREEERNFQILGSSFIDWQIIKPLSIMTKFSATYNRHQREDYIKPGSVLDLFVGDKSAPGSKTDNGRDLFEYTWLNQVEYANSFGKHHIDALVLVEFTKGNNRFYSLSSKGYPSPLLVTQENSSEPTGASTRRRMYTLFSTALTVDYDYDKKYIVSASIRRDGSSRFGKDNRYGTFWSSSLAWNMAKEPFLETAEFLDNLKLRLSYGTLGNWNIPNYASQGYFVFDSYDNQSAAFQKRNIGNTELTWEIQKSLNAGVEYSFLNRRIYGAIDYFINTRSDFLFDNRLPWEGGGYSQFTNAGKLRTNGLEFEISGDIIRTADFKWTLGTNITWVNYNIKELNKEQIVVDGITVLKEEEEPFTFYLPKYAGVNPDNGDALYYDKEGKITNVFSSGNAVALSGKSPLADFYGGFRTMFSYKGIDLSADFSFKSGNYTYNYMAFDMLSDGENKTSNQRVDAINFWRNPGDVNVLPRPDSKNNANQVTDRFLQDASYLRFRSLTLGYTFPKSLVEKIKLHSVRLYAQAQNLHIWTDFEGDPEVSVGSGENQLLQTSNFIPGAYALYSYPITKSFIIGLNINF